MGKKALYPGSFDPVTYGHINIIKRASKIFSEVTIAVIENPEKKPVFSREKRSKILKESCRNFSGIKVDTYDGLTVEYAKSISASVIIRGLRSVSDFEGEMQMAVMNKKMRKNLDTIFLMTDPEYAHISSSLVKEVAKYGGELSHFVPDASEAALQSKFHDENFDC